jgi:outer membrane protein OmpA-like peptidoglycan-associated protein
MTEGPQRLRRRRQPEEEAIAAVRRAAKQQQPRPARVPDPRGPRAQEELEREARGYAERFARAYPTAGRSFDEVKGGGRPLPAGLRQAHEALLGVGLADVRLSDGRASEATAERLGARAFQEGEEIHLGRTAAAERGRLVAHELAHVAQARQGRAEAGPQLERGLSLLPEVPAPEVVRTPVGISVTVYFSQGNFVLGGAGAGAIERLREELALLPDASLRIDGFASAEGSESYNLSLSETRRQLVRALLLTGLPFSPEVSGEGFGEAQAGETEVEPGEREHFRARQRRVEVTLVSSTLLRAAEASEPARPEIEIYPPRIPFRLETDQERLERTLRTPVVIPPPATFSVCGRWREETRTWFDRRLRDLGVAERGRGILTDLGVGAVERLPFLAIEEGLKAGEIGETERRAIMSAVRGACQQEWRR